MRIEVRTQGGFAGLRRPPLVVETDELDPELGRQLERLATALPKGPGPGRGADLMRYDVQVDAGGTRRQATYFEPAVPEPVRDLLRLARQAGRRA
ncbi:MAG TPA: protealysin inhibitor emfourin [Solirubrobacteraceae bacterium]|nr:protealysin inhibitor emfourin [Solirubrobacteraceae bacterium]